ncbi:MAG TPA: hypothetical protein VGJ26_14015 [Pirellulales bacterium]|jgi:hypothetical protein
MVRQLGFATLCVLGLCVAASAAEYGIESAEQALPTELAGDVAKQLAPTAFKVTNGKKGVCEVWLAKKWPAKADFKATEEVLYPFEVGELIGAIRLARKTTDFRNQEIAAGVYTLRYGQQPVDGNHVGTSPTRDFLLLSPAAEDKNPARVDKDKLFKISKDAAKSTHPAIMTVLPVPDDADAATAPTLVHDEAKELWSALLKGTAGDKNAPRLLNLVIVGHGGE